MCVKVASPLSSLGQVVCGDTPGGGAMRNSLGQVRTGPGQCVLNFLGQVMCSAVPGGGAAVNSLGQVVCAGGCVPGRWTFCLAMHLLKFLQSDIITTI